MRRIILRISVYIWHGFICFAVLVALLTLLWVSFYGLSVHRRARAERLIRDIAALNFAHPDEATFQQLKKEIGSAPKCTGDVCSYQSEESFGFSNSGPFRLLRRTEWDYVGVRPWRLTLEFKTQHGRVSNVTYSVMVGRGRGWLYRKGPLSGSMWSCWAGLSEAVLKDLIRLSKSKKNGYIAKHGRVVLGSSLRSRT